MAHKKHSFQSINKTNKNKIKEFVCCDKSIAIADMVNDDDIIEIVLSESNEQDTNDCNNDSEVSETPKKISFEAALTALKTMTEFIEQQPDNSLVAREDVVNYSVYVVILN